MACPSTFQLPRLASVAAVVIGSAAALSCGGDRIAGPAPVASVTVAIVSPTMGVGTKTQATATMRAADGSILDGRSVTWSSGNSDVASVSATGEITALKAGTAEIKATSEGKSGSATVTAITITEVVVTLPQPGLSVGFSIQASASVKDASGNPVTGLTVTWSSSNTGVATVNQAGVVTGVSSGTADIIATSSGKTSSAPIGVIVIEEQSLSAGSEYTCAIALDGDAYCWGRNYSGQLGDGTTTDRLSPVKVAGGLKFSAIAAKTSWTYTLTSDGRLFCWGDCDPSTAPSLTPRQVDTKRALFSLAREMPGNCGIGVGNVAYCWRGLDAVGRVSVVPDAPAPGDHAFLDISGYLAQPTDAATRVCGLTAAGAAYCWGSGYYWLGDGPGGSRRSSVPVRVAGNHVFKDIAIGHGHACGVTTAGETYCWGAPRYTGHAGPMPESCDSYGCHTPVLVAGGHIFESIIASFAWTCGLTAGGDPYCWGQQPYGQTPVSFRRWSFGEAPDYQDPYANVKYRTVSPGGLYEIFAHACATSTEGDVYCMNHQQYDGTDAADRARAVRKIPAAVKFRAP